MSAELAKELRLELHYGIKYVENALDDGSNKTNATAKLVESRSAMVSYISAVRDKDYFSATRNPSNDVIEMDPDILNDSDLPKDITPSVKEVKSCIAGISMGIEKLMNIRLSRLIQMNPKNSYKALRSLDRAIDSLESCVGYLFNELHKISSDNPGAYPTFLQEEIPAAALRETHSNVDTTNNVMEERAGIVGNTGNIGDQGEEGIMNSEESEEEKNEKIRNPETGDGIEPSDPTEGFSESNTTEQ